MNMYLKCCSTVTIYFKNYNESLSDIDLAPYIDPILVYYSFQETVYKTILACPVRHRIVPYVTLLI